MTQKYLVSRGEHRIKLIVSQRPVSLVDLPLPPESLQLLRGHGDQVAWSGCGQTHGLWANRRGCGCHRGSHRRSLRSHCHKWSLIPPEN